MPGEIVPSGKVEGSAECGARSAAHRVPSDHGNGDLDRRFACMASFDGNSLMLVRSPDCGGGVEGKWLGVLEQVSDPGCVIPTQVNDERPEGGARCEERTVKFRVSNNETHGDFNEDIACTRPVDGNAAIAVRGLECDGGVEGMEEVNDSRSVIPRKGVGGDQGPDSPSLSEKEVKEELKRLVRRVVDRLRHRKEVLVVRNEADLPLQRLCAADEEELGTVSEAMPSPESSPAEAAMAAEDRGVWLLFKWTFVRFLKGDKEVGNVFECISEGLAKRGEIAKRLGMSPLAVKNAMKRLDRKLLEFQKSDRSGFARRFVEALEGPRARK